MDVYMFIYIQKYSSDSAWWNFCAVGNYAARYYKFAMVTVRQLQTDLTTSLIAATAQFEKQWQENSNKNNNKEKTAMITKFTVTQGDVISKAYKELLPLLITKYRDGMVFSDLYKGTVSISRKFYNKDWLTAVGYFNAGPPNTSPEAILFSTGAAESASTTASSVWWSSVMNICLGWCLGILSLYLYKWYYPHKSTHSYIPISGLDNVDQVELPFTKSYF